MITTPLGGPGRSPTLYDAVGGMDTFVRLADAFYEGVAADVALLSLYPEPDDLAPAAERLSLFLAQYFGGPTTYSERRGHPRLRMRHAPFHIDSVARDRWLSHMRAALDSLELAPESAEQMWDYFTMAAEAMRNAPADGAESG
jgi:hemoglobin